MRGLRALLVVGLVTPWLAVLPGTAQAQGADAQGWWNEFHTSGQPAPPAPPDVAADDLLLQGGDPARLLPAGALDQTPAPSALGALRFQITPGSDVGALVLHVGSGAQASDVRAYPTDSAWIAVQDGAIADAPTPDFSRFSSGRLSADGATLTFPDIGRLVTEQGLLSVVFVPAAADRVVVHKPLPTALAVTAPPVGDSTSPASPYPRPMPVEGPVVGPMVPFVDGPATVTLPAPAAPSVVQPGVVPHPVVAAPTTTQAAVAHRLVPDDTRDRLTVLLEALLVVAFFGLLGQGPLAFLARITGAGETFVAERGIGRFATARVGRPPRQ